MRNRLQQKPRTAVKTSGLKYVAGGIAFAVLGGFIIFSYLNFGQSEESRADDTIKAWFIDFGSGKGEHIDGLSSTFLPIAPSGTSQINAVKGGRFSLQNPGLRNFGTNSELKIVSSDANNPAKFSVIDYQASKHFYVKYTIRWEGGNDGEWVFAIGNGSSFSDNNSSNFPNNQIFTAFKATYLSNKGLTVNYLKNNSWTPFPSSLAQHTNYTIEIYGNNSTATENYKYPHSCAANSIAPNKMDLYINGEKVGDDLDKGGIADNSDIDSFMFFGAKSTNSTAVFFLDDIIYANSIPVSTIQPNSQPYNIAFSNVSTNTAQVDFSPANNTPDGYLVLRKAGSSSASVPSDFKDYKKGDTIGDAIVAYIGSDTSFFENNLESGMQQFYSIFSFYGAKDCKNYLNTLPLSGTEYTFAEEEQAIFRSAVSQGEWNQGSNWEYEYLPGRFKRASKYPTIKAKSVTILEKHKIVANSVTTGNLKIKKGGSLTVEGDLTINNSSSVEDMVNEGSLIISGSLNLLGEMKNEPGSEIELASTSNITIPAGVYSNLKVSNGGGTLKGDISINESLVLNKVSIETQGHFVTLSSNAKLSGETNENYIKGKVKMVKEVSGRKEDFGSVGVIIDASKNKQHLGEVVVIRSTEGPIAVGGTESIGRNWSIEPAHQPTEEVTLTLNWLEGDEKIPFQLSTMQVWKSTDKGKTWNTIGEIQSATNRSISVKTTSFSDWTASEGVSKLPVKFRSFTGKENIDGSVTISWVTSEELNNEGFQVEKSLDGKQFAKLSFINGEGTSSDVNSYEYTDDSFGKSAYFRLKQIDYNGVFEYSSVIYVEKKTKAVEGGYRLYPNPVIDHVEITTSSPEVRNSNLSVIIYSSKGKEMYRRTGSLEEINKELNHSLYTWIEDIYIVDIKGNGKVERLKMIKKK